MEQVGDAETGLASNRQSGPIGMETLERFIRNDQRHLARLWNEAGYWRDSCDAGPAVTGVVTAALFFMGQLDKSLAAEIHRYLSDDQLRKPDPSNGRLFGFPSFPEAEYADLGSTAACYAGLVATGADPEKDERVKECKAFIDANGGENALIKLARGGDLAALAMALVKKLNTPLPKSPILFGLTPGSEYLIEQRLGYLLPFRCLISDVLAEYLADPTGGQFQHLPRFVGMPRNARDISDLMMRRLDGAADEVSKMAATLTKSSAGAVTSLLKGGVRAMFGIAQGGMTAASGLTDSLRYGPATALEGAAKGILESGQAVVSGAAGAVSSVDRLRPEVLAAGDRAVNQLTAFRCDLYLHRFRNQDGSWLYGDSVHTALALAAYHALRVPATDQTIAASLQWLKSDLMLVRDNGKAHFNVFYADIWPTAFVLRALIESGTPVADPAVSRAINWLIAVQRSGSWAFQATNNTTPDMDDTAVAMAALATARKALHAAQRKHRAPFDPNLTPREQEFLPARIDAAIETARVCLLSNQNADGGWASYQPHLPGKRRGPIMTTPPDGSAIDGPLSQLRFAMNPPVELGDPATEDVTGRVLFALGRSGLTAADPAVKNAIQFLINQQDTNGGWWGRWVINYVASTAWVLRGLAAVKADLKAEYVQRAVSFLLGRKQTDGGWLETAESYRRPSQEPDKAKASNRPLTGLVLSALIEIGKSDTPDVIQGIELLVGGAPLNQSTLHCLYPPTLFYTLPLTQFELPLEALALYRKSLRPKPPRNPSYAISVHEDPLIPLVSPITDEAVKLMKETGDPDADEVIEKLFTEDDENSGGHARIAAIFQMLGTVSDTGDLGRVSGVSSHVREEVVAFINQVPRLSIDKQKLATAQGLFRRAGFGVPLVLFCSSLPQCFAVKHGAKVLMTSRRLATNPRRRLVETAQLVFDVLAEGGMDTPARNSGDPARGQGIRTAHRVRLMHAAIRRLVRDRSASRPAISQFDLLGTLMTFSIVVTDGLRALGLPVSEDEANAWFSVWMEVGKVLGITPNNSALLTTAADGADFFQHVREEWTHSTEGATLARVNLEVMEELLPGKDFDGIGPTLVRHLAGDRCADLLDIEPADWTKILVDSSPLLSTLLGQVVGHVLASPLAPLLQRASFGTVLALNRHERENKGAPFTIPQQLIDGWDSDMQRRFRSS